MANQINFSKYKLPNPDQPYRDPETGNLNGSPQELFLERETFIYFLRNIFAHDPWHDFSTIVYAFIEKIYKANDDTKTELEELLAKLKKFVYEGPPAGGAHIIQSNKGTLKNQKNKENIKFNKLFNKFKITKKTKVQQGKQQVHLEKKEVQLEKYLVQPEKN